MRFMQKLLHNKKASFDYEILDRFEAGIELLGFEVKSLKTKKGSLDGSHVTIRGNEAFLINMGIPPYQPANAPQNYDEHRWRKLLLTKKEIVELADKESQRGLTIVPISVYNKGRKIKLEVAVVRGKKKRDKRQDIKKRDTKRELDRSLKYE